MSISATGLICRPYRRWDDGRSFWFRGDCFDLTRFHENTMGGFACEVLDTLYGAVVLALGNEEFNAHPFSWREGCCAKETNDASASRYLYDCPKCDHRWWHLGIRPQAQARAVVAE